MNFAVVVWGLIICFYCMMYMFVWALTEIQHIKHRILREQYEEYRAYEQLCGDLY
jgi:hypothetical protein